MKESLYYFLTISMLVVIGAGCKSQTEHAKIAGQKDPNVQIVKQKNANELYNLGKRYSKGDSVEKDMAKAVECWRKAAEQGNAKAQYELGCCYARGEGVEEDSLEAIKWFRMSAELGYDEAQVKLGDCYKYPFIERDMSKAVKWYRKAAEQGNAWAQHSLSECYANGDGVEKDMSEAFKWCQKSAEHGSSVAQYDLGMRYMNGDGVEKNMVEAIKWLHKSAEQGWTNAQLELGRCYVMGKGIEKNMPEALKWLRKVAVDEMRYDGYDVALRVLGESYASRDGVPSPGDSYEEVEKYNKAVEQGIVYAQGVLGLRYTNSDGVIFIDSKAPFPETLCGICYKEFGQFGPTERWTMDFVKSEITYELSERSWEDPKNEKVVCYLFDKEETAKVISDCRSFDFSKWKHRYNNPHVYDGTSWIMTLKYSDGRQREISGSNKWPDTFNLFNTVITNAYFKATDKWPTGMEKIKPDIKGGKYNNPRENYLWKEVKSYFKATDDNWPFGKGEIKPDIKGGKYNNPRENYLWKDVK